jgi:Zn-dependent peptidase ImmA (M78 family)/transcriptional regulator with XRE-family HTH domain
METIIVSRNIYMEAQMTDAIGRNLKTARDLAGLSQEAFAEKLGMSRATLSAIENGRVAIDSTKLLLAAKILGRSPSDFFKEREDALALLYRAGADVSAPQDVRAHFERFCKAHRELEDILRVGENLLRPPDYSYSPGLHARPLHYATRVAYSERERLGLGQRDPIENIFKLLDEQGVRILRLAVEDHDIFGISAFSPEYGLCILVNKANTLERQIFSLVHEYGHLLMHRGFYKSTQPLGGLPKDNEMEQMADVFAANFLVPEFGLREVFLRDVGEKTVGLEDVLFLKHYFRVSGEMMLRRFEALRLVSTDERDQLLQQINLGRQSTKEEIAPLGDQLTKEWEQLSRFQHLARKAALEELVSLSKLAELLDVNVVEARKKVREWREGTVLAQA